MGSRDDDANRSDYAFLEGRLLRVESEQKAIRRIHGELAQEVERLNQAVGRMRQGNDEIDPWRETTDIRNQRRLEMDSLRARARDAEAAEVELATVRAKFWRQLAVVAPAGAAVLYAIAELVRSLAHH